MKARHHAIGRASLGEGALEFNMNLLIALALGGAVAWIAVAIWETRVEDIFPEQ